MFYAEIFRQFTVCNIMKLNASLKWGQALAFKVVYPSTMTMSALGDCLDAVKHDQVM